MEKTRILVVDDEKHIAELISLYLMKEGYETREVYDGRKAMDEFYSFKPELVMLDIMLPGTDGYQVCTTIRKNSELFFAIYIISFQIYNLHHGLSLCSSSHHLY